MQLQRLPLGDVEGSLVGDMVNSSGSHRVLFWVGFGGLSVKSLPRLADHAVGRGLLVIPLGPDQLHLPRKAAEGDRDGSE